MHTILRTLLMGLMLTVSSGIVSAGPFEDANDAYDRGDYATALRLICPLAEQGDAAAQYNLGFIYKHGLGQGVSQNYSSAYMWFNIAAARGVADAAKDRDRSSHLMTPKQIARAEEMARQCQARNFKNCD